VIRDPNFSYRDISHTASRGEVKLFLHFARERSGNHARVESSDESDRSELISSSARARRSGIASR
jgi:hypothetical protein